jgi:threonylcarbamoyladenosine tRNA methylthiotransferase MtaB
VKKRIAFYTLGCRLNQYETDCLAADFQQAGYEVVPFEEQADGYIINTCTVTGRSEQKARKIIRRASARSDGKRALVVTGCWAGDGHDLSAKDNVFVVDNSRKSQILHLLDAHFGGEAPQTGALKHNPFGFRAPSRGRRTRGMIKIQDGCDNFCTYCIVPFVRGRAVSRSSSAILEELRSLLASGYREVVLTGVNIGSYHSDGLGFPGLLEKILSLPGDFRVRLSSLEPEAMDTRLLSLLSHPKMCPHLHLCLQSGSDRILGLMGRGYTSGQYLAIVERIRRNNPYANLTTDVIVGFPGETRDDFDATCRIVTDVGFGHVHTFRYSPRKGTRAFHMPGQVSESEKIARSEEMRELSLQNKLKYRRSLMGRSQSVLIEKIREDGMAQGYGEHYVPVAVSAESLSPNTLCRVTVSGVLQEGEPVLLGVAAPALTS